MGPNWGDKNAKLEELEIRHKHIECWPNFDAVRQYEWIRVGGQFNMLTEYGKVIQEMTKLGFYDALCWMELCREHKIFFGNLYGDAMDFYCKETPRNQWFDKEFVAGIQQSKKRDLQQKMKKLQQEIKDLEDK